MNLPPFPSIPQSPEERLRWVAWKTDAERMDWLEKANPVIFHKGHIGDKWEICTDPESDVSFTGDTLRAAIDAARSGGGGKGDGPVSTGWDSQSCFRVGG